MMIPPRLAAALGAGQHQIENLLSMLMTLLHADPPIKGKDL
jgi:hypothetical protein